MPNQFTASLWGDEGFSAILSMKSLPDLITTMANDTSPPLWNIFEWIVFNTLGTNEVYIRGLSFLFFVLTVFFAYKIEAYLFNKETGVIAALLTFLNPFFFIYAFEGRMYSILALGVTASMYFFLKRNWPMYTASMLWAMYSHHFAIFALFLHGLWFLWELFSGKKEVARGMFKSFIAIAVLYSPWMIPLYNQTTKVSGGFWLATPDVSDLVNLISDYLARGIQHPLAKPALFVVLAALITRKWWKRKKKTFFLVVWFIGPIILTWLMSQVFQPIFFNRYLLYTIPGAMLVLSSKRSRITNVLLIVVVVLFGIIDYNYFLNPTKIPFRDLAGYVQQTRKDGDFLINADPGRHKLGIEVLRNSSTHLCSIGRGASIFCWHGAYGSC